MPYDLSLQDADFALTAKKGHIYGCKFPAYSFYEHSSYLFHANAYGRLHLLLLSTGNADEPPNRGNSSVL
jgi:hypothetical protein